MKNLKIITFLFFFSFLKIDIEAQSSKKNISYTKTLNSFSKKLKECSKVEKIDTINNDFGYFQNCVAPYFDTLLLRKKIEEKQSEESSIGWMYVMQQSQLTILQQYVKKIPLKYLVTCSYKNSLKLDKDWRNNDKEEIDLVENSLLLRFKNQEKQINLLIINFNPENNKILYLVPLGFSVSNYEYLQKYLK